MRPKPEQAPTCTRWPVIKLRAGCPVKAVARSKAKSYPSYRVRRNPSTDRQWIEISNTRDIVVRSGYLLPGRRFTYWPPVGYEHTEWFKDRLVSTRSLQ